MAPSRSLLTPDALKAALASLEGWSLTADQAFIERTFKFDDFSAAWGFMSRAAIAAEVLDHHPNWSNVYNRVDVHLQTHDAGGVTALDIELAKRMNSFFVV